MPPRPGVPELTPLQAVSLSCSPAAGSAAPEPGGYWSSHQTAAHHCCPEHHPPQLCHTTPGQDQDRSHFKSTPRTKDQINREEAHQTKPNQYLIRSKPNQIRGNSVATSTAHCKGQNIHTCVDFIHIGRRTQPK